VAKYLFYVIFYLLNSHVFAQTNYHCLQNKFWANEAISGDLMVEAMAEWRKSHPRSIKTKVAIVDSGLRKSVLSDLKSTIQYYSLSNDLVDPERAETTHGYSVASIYAAHFGLYQRGEIGIYGVSIPGSEGGLDSKIARQSYIDACERGYKIINASHGSDPNFYAYQDETAFKATFDLLKNRGCLVIKSAGNESNRGSFLIKDADIDDAYLRVASTRFTGGFAEHSNIGEIAAPGDKIYTLAYNPKGICSDRAGHFTSGTSFSGPLVGAVAANVREVLSVNSSFGRISGDKQLAILNRVLKAASSPESGFIDGFRAVKLAMLLESYEYESIPSVADLNRLDLSGSICAQKDSSGLSVLNRKKLSLCSTLSTQELDFAILDIFKTKRYHLLNVWKTAVLNSTDDKYALPSSIQNIGFWRDFFSSRVKSQIIFEKKTLSDIDITAIIDIYTGVRKFLTHSRAKIDALFVESILQELMLVPTYISQYPLADTNLSGFYSETKASNEIGFLIKNKIAEDLLVDGLVTNFLAGKTHAFWSIMVFAPYKSRTIQHHLERILLVKNAGNLTPNDLLNLGAIGTVENSYQWMKSVILSDRILEAKHKSDIESTVISAFNKGNIGSDEKTDLLDLVRFRLN